MRRGGGAGAGAGGARPPHVGAVPGHVWVSRGAARAAVWDGAGAAGADRVFSR